MRDHGLLTNAVSLVLCGLLAGLVVAAAAFPALAMTGLATKSGSDTFENLPSDFTVLPSPQITNVYASDGKTLLASIYDENRRDIPLTDVAPIMRQAIVAAEDKEFYKHHGVDLRGVLRAVVNNQNGGDQQGGSTLTMQYVRQLAQYSARTPEEVVEATEKTNGRKLREIKYSIAIEKKMTKDQILEGYLNIASFGEGAWGVQAASMVYFNKPPKDLTLPEAALLASLPKAPSIYDPVTPEGKQKALERSRGYVLKNMLKLGNITQIQYEDAIKADPKIIGNRPPQGCTEVQHPDLGAGFFCDYLRRWWSEQKDFGDNQFERENLLRSGGFTITTSLDLTMQRLAYQRVLERTPVEHKLATMMAAVEPGTGHVKALAVNRIFSNNQGGNLPSTDPDKQRAGIPGTRPNTTLPLLTGSDQVPGYQSGSVFKMFTMVAALERGFPLSYTINAKSPYTSKYIVAPGPAACGTHYCPRNANPSWMNGPRTMWSGFGRSVNTYFVPLEEQAGAENVVAASKRLGIKFRSKSGDPDHAGDFEMSEDPSLATQWGAFTLGVSLTTPLDVANAWATLANDGKYCEPSPVLQILDRNGKPVKAGDPHCGAPGTGTTPDVARAALDAGRCPVGDRSSTAKCDGGTATEMRGKIGHPIAGKTGTTDTDNTATMTVVAKQLAVSGFVLDPDSPNRPGSAFYHEAANGAVGGFMKDALAGAEQLDFPPPSGALINGNQVNIPSVKCMDVDGAKRELSRAGFVPEVGGDQVQSDCPAGRVAGTDPSGRAPKGSAITIQISKGAGQQPPNPGNPRPTLPGRR